jgi:hypothetical protein
MMQRTTIRISIDSGTVPPVTGQGPLDEASDDGQGDHDGDNPVD